MSNTEAITTLDTTLGHSAPQVIVKQSYRRVLIAVIVVSVLVLLGLGGFAVHQHQSLGQSQHHAATVSSQLADTKKDLATAKSDNADLTTQNQALTDTAKKCAVYPAIVKHMSNALSYELKAVTGGSFGSIIWLPKASDEMRKTTGLLNSHQSYDGELQDVCSPSSVSNS